MTSEAAAVDGEEMGVANGYRLVRTCQGFALFDVLGRPVPVFSSEDALDIFDCIKEAASAPAQGEGR